MKTSINSKKFTQSLLLMSILCMSLNIMAPDEEAHETNQSALEAARVTIEKITAEQTTEKRTEQAKKNEAFILRNDIRNSHRLDIGADGKGNTTIERSLWEQFTDLGLSVGTGVKIMRNLILPAMS
ncbi:MAG: hypothetical protein NTW22_07585 [Proteobacteria bacterium]|nr:hypothetical protein [Pseudomonadota bacterium]